MAALLTLSEAKTHLLVTGDDNNEDILAKMGQATDLVVKHLDTAADAAWTSATVPGNVKSAICVTLAYLYEHRGDNMELSADIWTAVERLLVATRPSALA